MADPSLEPLPVSLKVTRISFDEFVRRIKALPPDKQRAICMKAEAVVATTITGAKLRGFAFTRAGGANRLERRANEARKRHGKPTTARDGVVFGG